MDEAIAEYERALDLDPKHADAHVDLAAVSLARGELEKAKQHLLAAERLQPNNADIHNHLGGAYLKEGNLSQAILQYEEALRIDPQSRAAQENLRMAKASDTRFRSPSRE
jgi:tetratricopeptide (TPR) repeat protein